MTEDKRTVVALYADQNGAWDARNADNEIIAVGSVNDQMPQRGEIIPEGEISLDAGFWGAT